MCVTAAPGTGSTSLLAWAQELPGARRLLDDDVLRPDGTVEVDAKHATVTQVVAAGLVGWSPQDRTIVTSTRNPFDHWHAEWFRTRTRWAQDASDPTSWVHRVEGMADRIEAACHLPFPAWLEAEVGTRADAGDSWHLNPGHIAEADVVLRMEHLPDDVDALLERLGAQGSAPPVPHQNRTRGREPYQTAYTDRARAIVAQVNGPDLARFGYTF